jgi:hypothetical protein
MAAMAALVLALGAVACSDDTGARSTASPVSPRPAERPSQSPADAKRDGVVPDVAALPFGLRIDATSTVEIDDDRWAVSRLSRRGQDRIGCEGPREGREGIDFVCGSEYGELVQIRNRRVLRAYPLPGVPPQHIAITDDAVYCARQGDGGLPDSMVCRVDRRTHEAIVRVFPSEIDSGFADTDRVLPDDWSLDEAALEVNKFAVDDSGVWAKAYMGGWAKLDPETLEVVERDIERVTTDP